MQAARPLFSAAIMSERTSESTYPRALAVPLDAAVHSGGGGDSGDWLAWRVRAAGVDHGFARGDGPDGCLPAFLALEAAPAEAFPDFARRWGVLGICAEHQLPGVHAACAPREGELAHELFNFVSMTEGWTVPLRIYQEPISLWRETAATMAAALRLGRALRRDEPGARGDVSRLFGDVDVASSKPAVAVGGQRTRLSGLTNGWLRASGFRPSFEWPFTASKPELVLDAPPNDALAGLAADGGEGFRWPARSLYSVLLTQFLTELASG